jgi:multiple sugar transport system substrate-binding protein
MSGDKLFKSAIAMAAGAILSTMGLATASLAQTEITLWSHWADQNTKIDFVETAARNFEAKNPGTTVKITWFQKKALFTALKTALRAGQAPDIFYAEPNQTELIDNGFLANLNDGINWNNVEDWAKAVWTRDGVAYGLPLEAYTVELYYNKDLMAQLGQTLPDSGQLDQAAFATLVDKSAAAGITPVVQGVGDRPYPGMFLIQELLLKKLGKEDYGKLLTGGLSFKDPRVIEVFTYLGELVGAGVYPKSFASLKLGESHTYFHTDPGGLMIPMGSWYTSRAFNAPDEGGQPVDFPLGIMQFPAMNDAACNNCKTLAVGGSFVVNADSENKDAAMALLNEMATPEMGNKWLTSVLVQTGIKSDPSSITGPYAEYFKELAARDEGQNFFIGIPLSHLKGGCKDAFIQIVNTAFPAGLISVEDATTDLDAACYAG